MTPYPASNETMKHLGMVLYYFANLDPMDRCLALDEAQEFYNRWNPDARIEPEPYGWFSLNYDSK